MGVYSLNMGKGVIVPIKYFISLFHKEFDVERARAKADNPEYVELEFDGEFILKCIYEKTGIQYEFSPLGHDAFKSRDNTMEVLCETKNYKVLEQINELKSKEHENVSDDICYSGMGELIFIGFYEALDQGGEFEYYVKAPEVIYGLTSLLDQICEVVPKLKEKNCDELGQLFDQEALIWTFTQDCACCG